MNLPLLQPLVNTVRSWADQGRNGQESPGAILKRKLAMTFDQKYPRVADPLKYSDQQKLDLGARLGFATVGINETDLALSRTPGDTEFSLVANFVHGAILCWREENPENSDAAAGRKLLECSASLSAIDSKIEAARVATEQAQAEEQAFERAFLEFRGIPGKYRQLVDKSAGLEAERNRLTVTDFDSLIRQLLVLEYDPKPHVMIQGNIQTLLIQKQTLNLRLAVIDELLLKLKPEIEKLVDANRRLALQLDVPENKL